MIAARKDVATRKRIKPGLLLDLLNPAHINTLTCVRANNTATAWAFAESANPCASLQLVTIPANKVRCHGLRWIASEGLWSDTYADGTPIEPHFKKGVLIEIASTNGLLNSDVVTTQDITVTAQTYTLSAWGTGSITLSGAATGFLQCNGTLPDERAILTVTTAAGTLTLTVSGSVVLGQLEGKPFASSYIHTSGGYALRNADIITYPISNKILKQQGAMILEAMPAFTIPSSSIPGFGNNYLIDLGVNMHLLQTISGKLSFYDGSANNSLNFNVLQNVVFKSGAVWSQTGKNTALNGVVGTTNAISGYSNFAASMTIGGYGGSSIYNFGGYIRKLIFFKQKISDSHLIKLTT